MNIFNDWLNAIELPLLKEMHGALECGFLDFLMPCVSSLCKWGAMWIILAVVLLCFKKTRRVGVTMAISLLLGLLLCNIILKPLTMRIRPYIADPTITLLLKPESEFSFPSGHTISAFEGAFSIFLHNKKWGSAALFLAALIGFSRLYLMMHYFTDVIVGALLGVVCALIAYYLGKLLIKKTKMPV